MKFTIAFAMSLQRKKQNDRMTIVVGRDARISGAMVSRIVCGALQSVGCDVVDIGLTTTPTIEIAITKLHANGGIIITASHNPMQWNALKLLGSNGEFISETEAYDLLQKAEEKNVHFSEAMLLGNYSQYEHAIDDHIDAILQLPLVDKQAIESSDFTVVVDAINSTGNIAVPKLLRRLGIHRIHLINEQLNGMFAHNPEPLPEHLGDLAQLVQHQQADIGFAVDPDVDRLALIDNKGNMFGEEYTLVAVADYVLQHQSGNTVSNLSSTRALRDITEQKGAKYFASAVGEVNVVKMMKDHAAVIGGEGNGGVIYPELHYGRDALVGIALILSFMARSGKTLSQLKNDYPLYHIAKMKIELPNGTKPDVLLEKMKQKYSNLPVSTIDGLKIELEKEWVHIRKSNTEPIMRIYAESADEQQANNLAQKIINELKTL
jgi:phosphomannomutase